MSSYFFGKYIIPHSNIFSNKSLTFSFVNLKPVVPGHILVSPKRVVSRYCELTDEETNELWLMTQEMTRLLESVYGKIVDICIQDGEAAGQSIPHVHVHILPKTYPINTLDAIRKSRTSEEMAEEAKLYREILNKL